MSNWYETIDAKTDPIFQKIISHPFLKELMDGNLSREVFIFYIQQDAIYLSEYKKVLATVGVKCNKEEETQFFLDAATGIIYVEGELHNTFLKNETPETEPSPSCELYNSYLSRMANSQSLAEALAAVLPCFTIYKKVGDYILENQSNKENNPYQNWINTYGGEEFAASVSRAIEITNKHADAASDELLEKMEKAFEKASKLEWMFWDSAYNQEQWKV